MNLSKFCVDVATQLEKIGSPLKVIAGLETQTVELPVDDQVVFDFTKGGDEWTDAYVGPGQTASGPAPICTRFVSLGIEVRGVSRDASASRVDHCDYVTQLVEDLVVCIERVRKANRWNRNFKGGAFDIPDAGAPPQQGARYRMAIAIGVPVVERAKSVLNGSVLHQSGTVNVSTALGPGAPTDPVT